MSDSPASKRGGAKQAKADMSAHDKARLQAAIEQKDEAYFSFPVTVTCLGKVSKQRLMTVGHLVRHPDREVWLVMNNATDKQKSKKGLQYGVRLYTYKDENHKATVMAKPEDVKFDIHPDALLFSDLWKAAGRTLEDGEPLRITYCLWLLERNIGPAAWAELRDSIAAASAAERVDDNRDFRSALLDSEDDDAQISWTSSDRNELGGCIAPFENPIDLYKAWDYDSREIAELDPLDEEMMRAAQRSWMRALAKNRPEAPPPVAVFSEALLEMRRTHVRSSRRTATYARWLGEHDGDCAHEYYEDAFKPPIITPASKPVETRPWVRPSSITQLAEKTVDPVAMPASSDGEMVASGGGGEPAAMQPSTTPAPATAAKQSSTTPAPATTAMQSSTTPAPATATMQSSTTPAPATAAMQSQPASITDRMQALMATEEERDLIPPPTRQIMPNPYGDEAKWEEWASKASDDSMEYVMSVLEEAELFTNAWLG